MTGATINIQFIFMLLHCVLHLISDCDTTCISSQFACFNCVEPRHREPDCRYTEKGGTHSCIVENYVLNVFTLPGQVRAAQVTLVFAGFCVASEFVAPVANECVVIS